MKNNLTDVTFIIPVRIDSTERKENVAKVIDFIKTHFETSITVLEADNKEVVFHNLIDKKIFIKDSDTVFYRTKYLNQMTHVCNTPYVAIWDTDVIVEPSQIVDSVLKLRLGDADFAFPFDGRFLNVPPIIRELFFIKNDMDVLVQNINLLNPAYGSASVGGAFIANRQTYIKTGMENETFYGWGMEDMERVKRWEISGCNIYRTSGPLFHLYHPRKQNSWFVNNEMELKSKMEFLRICKLSGEELHREVSSWNPVNKK